MTHDAKTAATLDRIELIVKRSGVYPDELDDVAFALTALDLQPADADTDHPLVDLYRALQLSTRSNGLIYLSQEHQLWLIQVLDDFGRI